MTSARDAILDRLRTARATARIPRVEAPAPARRSRPSLGECAERFQQEAVALGVECSFAPTPEAVRARVRALLAGQRVLSWDPAQLPYGIVELVGDAALGSSPRDQQAAAEVGVTGCDGAIAETGSLVMLSSPGRSHAVSLLPPLHVAIVRPEDLFFSMGEFFETRRSRIAASSSCTFITGPSRTADIELTLTLGIHGPARVVVVLGP